jgi:hypothetical protein
MRDDVQDYSFTIDPTTETISVAAWVEIVERVARNRPVRFDVLEKGRFRHPWNVACRWNYDSERWEANVEAGFVNGLDATVALAVGDAPQETITRVQGTSDDPPRGRVDARLTESPWVPLRTDAWRTIGTGAIGLKLEAVPEYFVPLGVREGSTIKESPTGVTVSTPDNTEGPRRLLRAQDVILTQERPALVPTVGSDGGFATIDFTLSPDGRERSFVTFVPSWEPPVPIEGLAMLSGATDKPFEQIRLATVYLLSGDGEPDGSEPSETWTPFLAHKVFWNLNYANNIDLKVTPRFERYPIPIPLAGGVAQPIVDELVDGITDAANQALSLLNNSKVVGKFWII